MKPAVESAISPRRIFFGAASRRAVRLSILVLFVGGTLGCSSMSTLEPLEVTLSNITFGEVTLFETNLIARLRITNPNPEPFTIDGASFKLILDDKKVGTGTTAETFTVERLESTVVDAHFHINNATAILRLADIFQSKEVSYGVRGSLFTQGAFGTKKIKVEKIGSIDLSQIEGKDKLPTHDGLTPLTPEG
jgi:LEA14-like dessication related protein